MAQELCDAGFVSVNNSTAKSSREVRAGDTIDVRRRDRVLTVRVLSVPAARQVSRHEAASLYEVLSDTPTPSDTV